MNTKWVLIAKTTQFCTPFNKKQGPFVGTPLQSPWERQTWSAAFCPKAALQSRSGGEAASSSQQLWWASFPGRLWTGGTVGVEDRDLPQLSNFYFTAWAGAQRVKVRASQVVASWSLQVVFPQWKWSLLAGAGRKTCTACCRAFPTLYQGAGVPAVSPRPLPQIPCSCKMSTNIKTGLMTGRFLLV